MHSRCHTNISPYLWKYSGIIFLVEMFLCSCFVPLEKFSLFWRHHHCRWRIAHYDLCSALLAIEQWGYFRLPHLLWHGASVYNGHLWGPVTLTPIAEHWAVELSLPVLTTLDCRGWDSNIELPLWLRTL